MIVRAERRVVSLVFVGLSIGLSIGLSGACQRPPTGGGANGGSPDDVAEVQAELTAVPTNAKCVRFTSVAATRTFQQSFPVTTGDAGTTLTLTGLPYNQALSITADAFNVVCGSVTATTPETYAADAQSVPAIAPGSTAVVSFVLKPTSNITGTVDFLYLTMTPTIHDFGPVVVTQQSGIVVFTVTNIGAVSTTQLAASIINSPVGSANQFNITTTTCNAVLTTQKTCTVQVVFAPTLPGAQMATLQVTGLQGGTVTASLQGFGQNPAHIVISPTSFNFGNQPFTTTSAVQDFAVTNMNGGVMDQAAGNVSPSLSSPDFHLVSSSCGATLPGGATCHLSVTFAPTSSGAKNATLVVNASPGGMVTAPLSGTGTSPLSVMPPLTDFGSATVGSAGMTRTLTFTNAGIGMPSGTMSLVNSNGTAFHIITDNCTGKSLVPSMTCTVVMQFFPNAAGTFTGNLTGMANAGWLATAMLTGTGI